MHYPTLDIFDISKINSCFKTKKNLKKTLLSNEITEYYLQMVPKAGLEPARGATTADFESAASANSATSANID